MSVLEFHLAGRLNFFSKSPIYSRCSVDRSRQNEIRPFPDGQVHRQRVQGSDQSAAELRKLRGLPRNGFEDLLNRFPLHPSPSKTLSHFKAPTEFTPKGTQQPGASDSLTTTECSGQELSSKLRQLWECQKETASLRLEAARCTAARSSADVLGVFPPLPSLSDCVPVPECLGRHAVLWWSVLPTPMTVHG